MQSRHVARMAFVVLAGTLAPAGADAPIISPAIRLQPDRGEAVDLAALTLDTAADEQALWLAWSAPPAGGHGAWAFVTSLPRDLSRPAFHASELTGAAFTWLREVRLRESAGGSKLLVLRASAQGHGESLWQTRIPAGGALPDSMVLTALPPPPSNILNWDLASWDAGHLLVWSQREVQHPVEFHAAFVDPEGNLSPSWRILTDAVGTRPRIVQGPGGGLVVWEQVGAKIYGLWLDAGGQSAGDPVLLWQLPQDRRVSSLEVAASPAAYLVVWATDALEVEAREIRAGRIDTSGAVMDPEGIRIGGATLTGEASLALGPPEMEGEGLSPRPGAPAPMACVAWWDAYDRLVARRLLLGDSLRVLDDDPVPLADPTRTEPATGLAQVSVSAASGGFWIAGIRSTGPIPGGEVAGEIWGQWLDAGGGTKRPGGLACVQAVDPRDPQVLWNGREFIVYLQSPADDGTYVFPFAVDPVELAAASFPPFTVSGALTDPQGAVHTSFGYLHAHVERHPVLRLAVARLDPLHTPRDLVLLPLADAAAPRTRPAFLRHAREVILAHDGARDLKLRRLTEDLQAGAEHSAGGSWGNAIEPTLIDAGDAWLLLWREEGAQGSSLRMARLTGGVRPDPAQGIVVAEGPDLDPGWAAAFAGEDGLIVWAQAEGDAHLVGCRRFDAAGNILDEEPWELLIRPESPEAMRLVWDGRAYMLFWFEESSGTRGVRILPDGSLLDPEPWTLAGEPITSVAAASWPGVLATLEGGRARLVEEPPAAPEPFGLLDPPPGDTLWALHPALTWSAARDLDRDDRVLYNLSLATVPDFDDARVYPDLRDTTFIVPDPLSRGETYFWTVAATDRHGLTAQARDSVWSFHISRDERAPFLSSITAEFDAETGHVIVSWSLAEAPQIGGLFVERAAGAWERLTQEALPPSSQGRFIDPRAPLWATVRYRLVALMPGGVEAELGDVAVLTAELAGRTRLLDPHPNPSAGEVALRFELASAAAIDLSIYDPAGRRVHSLVRGRTAAGAGRAIWDGRDARGRRAGGGVFLAVLRHPAGREVRKLIRIPHARPGTTPR